MKIDWFLDRLDKGRMETETRSHQHETHKAPRKKKKKETALPAFDPTSQSKEGGRNLPAETPQALG